MNSPSAGIEAMPSRAARTRSGLRSALIVLGQVVLVVAALYIMLGGWNRDLRVPLSFSVDSLIYLMQSKSTVDNGWWWFNPMLGAPFGLDELAFPSNSNVDQVIVWAVSRFTHDAAAAVTLAWTLMVILSGLSATWSLRRLGASTISSMAAGTLFALSPYALYRNIDHFSLVIYLVPFGCTAALLLASGRPPDRWYWKGSVALLTGCVLLGFNYVYYAFFACFCIAFASVVGWLAHRHGRILGAGALCVALIAGGTVLNLAPSLYSWSRHGSPFILRDKVPAESEVYGLKIRQLIGPLRHHPFPPFSRWAEREAAAQFPLDTENVTSRLGLVGSLGFLGLLALLLVPQADRLDHGRTLLSASRLTLAAVLLATIGGFGSVFNLLVSPDIRAYNRICPFIAFFSLTAVALAMDSLCKTRARRIAAAVVILAAGLIDQGTAAGNMNVAYPGIAAEMPPLQTFVRQLENRLPDRAMVLQLPFRTYLNDDGIARMEAYDHLKLYLVSSRIRWSYPALSNDQVLWQQAAARLDQRRLPTQLASEGFAAIVVDRYGYEDNGAKIMADLRVRLTPGDVIAQTDRYIALDIRSLAGARTESLVPPQPVPASLGIGACSGPPVMHIDQIGTTRSPTSEHPPHLRGSGEFKVLGWALDQPRESAAAAVDVVIDQKVFPSFYGSDRGDVADYFKRPAYRESGFTAAIPADGLARGPHGLSMRVVASDGTCYYQSPTVTIIID